MLKITNFLHKIVSKKLQMQKVVWKANTIKAEEASREMEASANQVTKMLTI